MKHWTVQAHLRTCSYDKMVHIGRGVYCILRQRGLRARMSEINAFARREWPLEVGSIEAVIDICELLTKHMCGYKLNEIDRVDLDLLKHEHQGNLVPA